MGTSDDQTTATWLPERTLVVVADSTSATMELLAAYAGLGQPVTMITRLRLDAALYDPAPPRTRSQRGAPRKNGARQPTLASRVTDLTTTWEEVRVRWYSRHTRVVKLATGTAVWYHSGMPVVAIRWVLIIGPAGKVKPQALLSTDVTLTAYQIVEGFVWRWQLDVTFEEARAHLGSATQRHWSEVAMLRTTPALLGLFSLVTLLAHQVLQEHELPVRSAAWYQKAVPTFSDTLALVRQQLWPVEISWMSTAEADMVTIPKGVVNRLIDTLAFAA